MSEMWKLINEAKNRELSNEERARLQACFIELMRQDLRVLRSEGLVESGPIIRCRIFPMNPTSALRRPRTDHLHVTKRPLFSTLM
jgi:hypothetical protein